MKSWQIIIQDVDDPRTVEGYIIESAKKPTAKQALRIGGLIPDGGLSWDNIFELRSVTIYPAEFITLLKT